MALYAGIDLHSNNSVWWFKTRRTTWLGGGVWPTTWVRFGVVGAVPGEAGGVVWNRRTTGTGWWTV